MWPRELKELVRTRGGPSRSEGRWAERDQDGAQLRQENQDSKSVRVDLLTLEDPLEALVNPLAEGVGGGLGTHGPRHRAWILRQLRRSDVSERDSCARRRDSRQTVNEPGLAPRSLRSGA